MSIEIGDKFKEFLYSDRRENSNLDYKIGIVKTITEKNDQQIATIIYDRKNQLKVLTEIEINSLEKQGDFWIRKEY